MTLNQCMYCKHQRVDAYTWGEGTGFYRISLACDLTVDYEYGMYPPQPAQ